MRGQFQLHSAYDLLAKLRHDYSRLREAPNDPYVAFDFFVTADHLLDWVYPGALGQSSRTAERDAHPILQVVSHLAAGARHMVPEDRRPVSVPHADHARSTHGNAEHGTATSESAHLVVNLEGAAAAELGIAATPLKLATRALQYWEDHPHFK
jgi:hypothetical protein